MPKIGAESIFPGQINNNKLKNNIPIGTLCFYDDHACSIKTAAAPNTLASESRGEMRKSIFSRN